MKKIIYILILFFCLAPFNFTCAKEKNPKTVNYFLHWSITEDEARELAKWDFLVLDMEVQENSPRELELIRQLNPKIKIIAYITSQNIFEPSFNSNESVLRKELAAGINDSWWLRDESGNRLSDWPNAHVLNVTDYCSPINSYRWNEYLPNFVAKNIMSSGFWDGVFYDNTWNGAAWFNGGNISLSNNGKRNSATELDIAWVNGMKKIFTRTKELWPGAIIVSNGSFTDNYLSSLNGWMLEDFPTPWQNGGTWSGVIQSYLKLSNGNQNYNIINNAASGQTNYADFRYGLTSSLMGNGFYSFDSGSADHAQLWWYDEYGVDLGGKQNSAYNLLDKNNKTVKSGLWRRDFTNGIALVNSTDKEQRYLFVKEEFEKISGIQDPVINNGQKINWVKIAPHDGLLLLKRPSIIYDNWFVNGNFFRIFNISGQQVRNGFFAYFDSYQGSQPLLFHNFFGSEDEQIASVSAGSLNIVRNGKQVISFRPYDSFKGNFGLTAADVNGDGTEEIITGAGNGGGPHIRIFNLAGKIKGSFMAYDKNFRGGVNVAAGDLNGDGVAEIVTGAGKGGGPHIRVFDASGQVKAQFMAYDKNFRGGVNVAIGDVDGDGIKDIVTGAGKGGGPQVSVFDMYGVPKKSFMAYDKNYRDGIFVAVYDINNDGEMEILRGISGF